MIEIIQQQEVSSVLFLSVIALNVFLMMISLKNESIVSLAHNFVKMLGEIYTIMLALRLTALSDKFGVSFRIYRNISFFIRCKLQKTKERLQDRTHFGHPSP